MKNINLPFASEVKKMKAAGKEAAKKWKTSTSAESSTPKKVRTLTSSFNETIDDVPISIVPLKELIPFGEEYVIPDDSDEENPSTASSEQLDE